ncbi:hypothetical protein V8E36_007369 [Tilletia maclaganii]
MARFSGPPGTSLRNPIIIQSSSQSQPSLSQVDQLQSSSQPSTQLTSASSARVPEPAPAASTAPRFHWTQQNEYDLVKAIKDNVDYTAVWLKAPQQPDDVKNDGDAETTGTKPWSKASIYCTISSQIFRQHEQNTPAQMRQKLIGLLETYSTGLLLSDMREGSIKTQREEYLERHPWYEMMHEMMLDREDSDPDIVVTGSRERQLRPEDDEDGSLILHDAGNDENGQSKGKAIGRGSQSDAYIAQFSRNMDEDRRLQLEREETKRRKLDLHSQQIIMQSQERERQSDLINTHLGSVFNRIEAMQVSMTARMDGLNCVLTGVMAPLDSLSAKLDRAFHH